MEERVAAMTDPNLKERLEEQEASIKHFRHLAYVPFLRRCEKCGWTVEFINVEPLECPTCQNPLWLVSEREYRETLLRLNERLRRKVEILENEVRARVDAETAEQIMNKIADLTKG